MVRPPPRPPTTDCSTLPDALTTGCSTLPDPISHHHRCAHTLPVAYFWAAQVNPVDNTSLIATYPLVHHLHGCIGLSLSLDGVRWSRVTPLLRCEAVGERALAHPAAPAMVRRGGEVWVYIQESVPGASVDAFLPKELYYAWADLEAKGRLARYTLPVTTLERWTRRARRSLQQ